MDNINFQIQELKNIKLAIYELRKSFDKLKEDKARNSLKEIIVSSDKIYQEFLIHSEKIRMIHNFADYYLKTVQKMVDQYLAFQEVKKENTEVQASCEKIEIFLEQVSHGFQNMYHKLFEKDVINADIEMKTILMEIENHS